MARQIELADTLARAHLQMLFAADFADPPPFAARFASGHLSARAEGVLRDPIPKVLQQVLAAYSRDDHRVAGSLLRHLSTLKSVSNAELALSAAIVGLQTGNWRAAQDFAVHAHDLSDTPRTMFWAEARWVALTARRLHIADEIDDYLARLGHGGTDSLLRRLQRDQGEICEYFADNADFSGMARAQTEISAVEATRLMVAVVDPKVVQPQTLKTLSTTRWIEIITQANGTVEAMDAASGRGLRDEQLAPRVHALTSLALIELLLAASLLNFPPVKLSDTFVDKALACLDEELARREGVFDTWPLISRAYRRTCQRDDDAESHARDIEVLDAIEAARNRRESVATLLEIRFLRAALVA